MRETRLLKSRDPLSSHLSSNLYAHISREWGAITNYKHSTVLMTDISTSSSKEKVMATPVATVSGMLTKTWSEDPTAPFLSLGQILYMIRISVRSDQGLKS